MRNSQTMFAPCTGRGCIALRYALFAFVMAVFLAVISPPAACAQDGLTGFWRIDVDASLEVNEEWRVSYNAVNERDRQAMRANWTRKTLVLDLPRSCVQVFNGDKLSQDAAVLEVVRTGADTRVVVARKDDKESAHPVVFTLLPGARLKAVIDDYTVMILEKARNPQTGAGKKR